jgi:predicted signal transduction protein with EAL and GGDEF domain
VIAQTIRDRVRALGIPHGGSDAAPFVTVSIGVATAACHPGLDPMNWIKAADVQLYLAKAAGRNAVFGRIFDERTLRNARSCSAPPYNTKCPELRPAPRRGL